MSTRRHHGDQLYPDLADAILAVGRAVRALSHRDPGIVELTGTEVNVMRYLDRHPESSPSAVAAATGMQRSNLSKALRGLQAKGLVERGAAATDSRQAVLRTTARAADNLFRLRRAWASTLDEALGPHTSRADLETALEVLRRIETGLAIAAAEPGGG